MSQQQLKIRRIFLETSPDILVQMFEVYKNNLISISYQWTPKRSLARSQIHFKSSVHTRKDISTFFNVPRYLCPFRRTLHCSLVKVTLFFSYFHDILISLLLVFLCHVISNEFYIFRYCITVKFTIYNLYRTWHTINIFLLLC